jgi:hypothetical protein
MGLAVPIPRTFTVGETETGAYFNALRDAVNFLLNPPDFKGRQATLQTTVTATWTPMNLDLTVIDTYGGHSNVTNNTRYTAQVPGTYLVWGDPAWTNAGAACRFESAIAKNGTIDIGSPQFLVKPTTDFGALLAVAQIPMVVGDYVEIWGRQNSGANLNTAPNVDLCPTFNALWIHA